MIEWWQLLVIFVVMSVLKWAGRYFLFKNAGVLFENIKSKLIGGSKSEKT